MAANGIEIDARELRATIAKLAELDNKIPNEVLKRAGHRIGEQLIKLLLKPTATWKHKPKITKLVRVSKSGLVVLVKINDSPYVWVTLGTSPRYIRPRRAKRLAFKLGYNAKTTPGSLGAAAGGGFGPVVYSMGVMHPGIEAREFHLLAFEEIKDEALNLIRRELEIELAKLGVS